MASGGESDSLFNATEDVHYNHLKILLNSVRNEFNVPDIPFVAGDFVHDWRNKHLDVCSPVIEAIRKVCSDYAYGEFVETDGLKSNMQELNRLTPCSGFMIVDDIHFSRKALYELGNRYYKAYTSILNK